MATVLGTFGDDTITPDGVSDGVVGGPPTSGPDSISGSSGNDYIDGGGGADTINGGPGADTLFGGSGNDLLDGGSGNDYIDGGPGDDTLIASSGNDTLLGGNGDDVLRIGGNFNQPIHFNGGPGTDTVVITEHSFLAGFSSTGVEVLNGGNNIIFGTDAGNDILDFSGLAMSNVTRIDGLGGDDVIRGGELADRIHGGAGNDQLFGNGGNDILEGGAGNDTLYGGEGNDILNGGGGDDHIDGGPGDDTLIASGGFDTLLGGAGDDVLVIAGTFNTPVHFDGGPGTDTIVFAETSFLAGLSATDVEILNGNGNIVYGTIAGDDILDLSGFQVVNVATVDGLGGNDTIIAATDAVGQIHYDGGLGVDTLVLTFSPSAWAGLSDAQRDAIDDYAAAPSGTLLSLPGLLTAANFEVAVVNVGERPTIRIADAQAVEGGLLSFAVTADFAHPTQAITATYTIVFDGDADAADLAPATPLTGTVTIAAGATAASIDVGTFDDLLLEETETFTVRLSNVSLNARLANTDATGTIVDNEVLRPTLAIADAQATEGGTLSFTVTTTLVDPGAEITATYTIVFDGAASAADLAPATSLTGTVTIAAGATTTAVVVDTFDDALIEGAESFSVVLSNPSANAQLGDAGATGTILDNEPALATLAIADAQATEGGALAFAVSTDFAHQNQAVTATYTIVFDGAASAADLAPATPLTGTVTIPAGATATTINIATLDDILFEGPETFSVVLGDPSANAVIGTGEAIGTIEDNDLPGPNIVGSEGDDTITPTRVTAGVTGGRPTNEADVIAGLGGNDLIEGGGGDDTLSGGNGADTLRGGDGDDVVDGGNGNDRLYGDKGNDLLLGGAGNDRLWGGAGNDTLIGGTGNDQLRGGGGNDVLDGGTGDDTLFGGDGNDVFVLRAGDGINRVQDFVRGDDRLGLDDGLTFADLTLIRLGGGVTEITLTADGALIALVQADSTAALTEGDFLIL
ncbi:MAG: Calx-beta domain-containing protein [Rhodospirillales bacterium]